MNNGLFGLPATLAGGASDRIRIRRPFAPAEQAKPGLRMGFTRKSSLGIMLSASVGGGAEFSGFTFGGMASSPTIMVLVGNTGTTANNIRSSVDGVTWTLRTPTIGAQLWGVPVWTGNRFIVPVRSSSTVSTVSTDGITWTNGPTMPYTGSKKIITFKGKLYLFPGGASATYWESSDDGQTWTSRAGPVADISDFARSARANSNTIFAIQSSTAYVTTDGINWVTATSDPRVVWANDRVAQIRSDGRGVVVHVATGCLVSYITQDYGFTWSFSEVIAEPQNLSVANIGAPSSIGPGIGSNPLGAPLAMKSPQIQALYGDIPGSRFVCLVQMLQAFHETSVASTLQVLHSADGLSWQLEPSLLAANNFTNINYAAALPGTNEIVVAIGAASAAVFKLDREFEELIYDYTV